MACLNGMWPRQAVDAARTGGQADPRLRQGEGGVLRRDDQIAGQRRLKAAAHGPAIHRRDDRLGRWS